jgi:death on curing protein
MKGMNFPNKFDVLTIHTQLIAVTGGREGLRDEGILESALSAPQNRVYYEQADLVTCAATYAYHLTSCLGTPISTSRLAIPSSVPSC